MSGAVKGAVPLCVRRSFAAGHKGQIGRSSRTGVHCSDRFESHRADRLTRNVMGNAVVVRKDFANTEAESHAELVLVPRLLSAHVAPKQKRSGRFIDRAKARALLRTGRARLW